MEREKIDRCLEAARLAPSASNGQPWRFVVALAPETRRAVAEATFGGVVAFNRFALQAPAMVVALLDRGRPVSLIGRLFKGLDYGLIDLGLAAGQFCLQAAEEGLGTCMLGWFSAARLRRALGIPRAKKIGLVIAMGYPAGEEIPPKKRKELAEIASYEHY